MLDEECASKLRNIVGEDAESEEEIGFHFFLTDLIIVKQTVFCKIIVDGVKNGWSKKCPGVPL